MTKSALVVSLLATLLFAGCVGDEDAAEPPATPGVPVTGGPSGPAVPVAQDTVPVWQVGDWWSYRVQYASGESYDAKAIVYAEDATHYHVTSDNRELLLRAAFTHYPTFGVVRKSDLAQDIHGTVVQYLRFPMENTSWSGTFRDFPATWTTTAAELETPKGAVPGFITTMVNSDDGLMRISNGWSAATKWFTNFTFDFDGVAPADVTYTLQDWGTNHTGTFPVLDIVDNVHRPFPTVALSAAAAPGAPDPNESTDTVTLAEGSSLLWGFFGGAGGAGSFSVRIVHDASGAMFGTEWQPQGPSGHFFWEEVAQMEPGPYTVVASGAAQEFAFLFVEAYEVRNGEGTLPAT